MSLFSSETKDLSENKEHHYLNVLKIPKNTVIVSAVTRLLGKWFDAYEKSDVSNGPLY